MGGFLLILTYAAFVSIFAQVWPALPSECVSLLPPAPPARAAAAARAGGAGGSSETHSDGSAGQTCAKMETNAA